MIKPNTIDYQPLVSIIMNCFNCDKYVGDAIDSVYAQTYTNWEVIFWDNASTDKSADIAKSYDSKLRYFRGKATIPLGSARNKALEKCRGEFIAFLDCDDLWMPEKLEKQMPLFQDLDIGLVFSDAIFFNKMGQRKQLYDRQPYKVGWCFPFLLSQYFLSIITVLVRRKVLDDLEYWFDPQFEIIEEADLFRRIGYVWKLAMVNRPLAKWRIRESSLTWTKHHLVLPETSLMLKKYSKIFPDFKKLYEHEINILNKDIKIDAGFHYLRERNNCKAREYLSPFKFSNKKAFIFYMMTLLPRNLFLLILRFRGSILPKDFLLT